LLFGPTIAHSVIREAARYSILSFAHGLELNNYEDIALVLTPPCPHTISRKSQTASQLQWNTRLYQDISHARARYYGSSFPISNLSADNMRWHTVDQVLADTVNFAKTAEIPGYEGEDFAAPGRPWILCG
jgi:hypothetical protein